MEWGREHRNVTKNMNSFDSKTDHRELSETPMDPTIIGMPPRLILAQRMMEMTGGDQIAKDLKITAKELRWVDDNNHTKNIVGTTTSDIYLGYRQPGLTKRARSRMMIMVDKVVNKTITDLHMRSRTY